MDIRVDGETVGLPTEELQSVGDVFERVDKLAAAKDSSVVAVTIDGTQIGTEEINEITERPVDAFDRFEFVTQNTGELVETLIGELESKIEELGALVRELATRFQGETETLPVDMLAAAVDAWQGILERIVAAANLLRVDIDTIEVVGVGTARDMHVQITESLAKLVEAVEQNDLVLVADLLEYEVAPSIERETDVLASVRQAATSSNTD